MLLFFSVLGGYLLGSIPFGYLIVKRKAQIDIRGAGSGSVGGFNAFAVTKSPLIGVQVGLLDGVKGVVAVGIPLLFGGEFWVMAAALISATVGHVFPVWLRFKGGRGLATACGGLFLIGLLYTIIWCSVWLAAKVRYKEITISNILATIVAPLILLLVPPTWIEALMIANGTASDFVALCVILTGILLISHRDGFSEFLKKGA